MKRIIQLTLLIIIFVLIYLFYAIYFKDKKEPKITKKNLNTIELNQKNNNSIQNLEYEVNIDEKNYYKIISLSSEIINEENMELLKMKNVEGIFINENSRILITSDNAIYNIINHKTNFKENVKIKYLICGGGRKNNSLIDCIKNNINNKNNFILENIDKYGFNGDYIESQAFGYLAIKSFLNLPISFPNTTGCTRPTVGGKLVKNF